jgi:hypothetical protein
MTPLDLLRMLGSDRTSRDRLRSDLDEFDAHQAARRQSPIAAASAAQWIELCEKHLGNARAALRRWDVDAGYQALNAAWRAFLPAMTDEERNALVVSLRAEIAGKLKDSWRGECAAALLEKPDTGDVPRAAIDEAWLHVQTQAQNAQRKLGLLRAQVMTLMVLLVILLGSAFAGVPASIWNGRDFPVDLLPAAIFFGLLGGALSAAIGSKHTDPKARIPDVRRSRLLTLTRVIIGGATAIPVLVLIKGKVVALGVDGDAMLLALCFLAGFSERWFLATIGDAEGKARAKPAGGG